MTNIEIELTELKIEVKNVLNAVNKMEKVVETLPVVTEKQNTAEKRVLDLESICETLRQQVQDLKMSNVRTTAYASGVATVVSFILHKVL